MGISRCLGIKLQEKDQVPHLSRVDGETEMATKEDPGSNTGNDSLPSRLGKPVGLSPDVLGLQALQHAYTR